MGVVATIDEGGLAGVDASPLRGALEAVAEPGAAGVHRPRDGAAALGQGLVLREFRVVLERTERGAP